MVVVWLPFLLWGCSGVKPSHLGCSQGRLSPCPDSPNCVSSQSADPSRYVRPFEYTSDPAKARRDLLSVLREQLCGRVVKADEGYIYVKFTSRIFRFVDDVEFCFDPESKLIYVRSASRVGYFDFGVNRNRVEDIRDRFSRVTGIDSS